MREQDFIRLYEADWQALHHFFNQPTRQRSAAELAEFPSRYRRLCEQLALAQAQGFSWSLITRLNTLAGSGHALLYRKPRAFGEALTLFILLSLPRTVRREWRWLVFSTSLFLIPLLIGMVGALLFPEYVEGKMAYLALMYEPSAHERLGQSRLGGTDVLMWGFYIFHNTTISLQALAGGALAGLLTAYVVVFNGIHLGLVSGYMINHGWMLQTFLPFIIAHGAFELTALILAGAVGFALAAAWFFPGRMARRDSIRQCLQRMYPLLVAVIAFDFIAAGLEAFWSARVLPAGIKYSVGILLWVGVIGYFLLIGRDGKADR